MTPSSRQRARQDTSTEKLAARTRGAGFGTRALPKSMGYAALISLLWSASALENARIFQWESTQAIGTGCLAHSDCAAGLFCKAEEPPEQECRSDRGWKVDCGTCRPCDVCLCNEDAIDASCPQDRCPQAPASIPRRLGVYMTRHIYTSLVI